MLKKKWIAFLFVAIFFSSFIIPNAHAESGFQPEKFPFKEMQVQVMPEFDYPEKWPQNTPSLLVGLYGTITNKSGQDYAGDIEIPIPTNEKDFQTNLVAEFPDPTKPEVQRPYNVDKQKGVVSWKPEKPIKNNETYKFVVEYYVNTINVSDKKSFTYSFTSPADIDQLNVIFYSPMNAKEATLDPKPQNSTKSDYGEDLYYYQYQSTKKGQNLKYTFTYKKDGTESTLAAINKMQPPNDSNHTGVKNGDTKKTTNTKQPIISIWGALIIGLAIIIAGIFVYFGLKGKNSVPAKGRNTTNPQPKKGTTKNNHKSANEEEKKELRKKLLTGKIDQETYDEEMKKLI